MRAEAAATDRTRPVWLSKLTWMVLVVIVPVIAAILMIAVALQIVGVPVWQTAKVYIGVTHSTEQSPIAGMTSQLTLEQAKDKELSAQNAKLTQQVQAAQQQNQSLQGQLKALQDELAAKADALTQAKKEAAVLSGMDAAPAAGLLAKLPVDEAAQVVAQMTSDVSGQILAQLDAAKAAQILSMAAQIETANTTDNTTANSAG